jgi:hypothetical protein
LSQLRVHAAQVQVPYVERDVQQKVADALGPGRAVLVMGHSMAGKTRLAVEVIRRRFPETLLLIPETGKALRELVDGELNPAGVVVWLDDLERFLGSDGLTIGLLNRLTSGEAILIATIRSLARETYRPRNELRPPEWDVLQAFNRIDLHRRQTEAELGLIRSALIDRPDVVAAVERYGLAEYLGAGPLAVDKFESGETTEPVGWALVRAAVDWRRSGLTRPIPRRVLASSALVAVYLHDRPNVSRSEQAVEQGLTWAYTEINETVALLGRRFTDPVDDTSEAFEAFDYLVDHLGGAGLVIPEKLWQLSLAEAQPPEWIGLGYTAYKSNNLLVAELALRKAADAGNSDAMYNVGGCSRSRANWARRKPGGGGQLRPATAVPCSIWARCFTSGARWVSRKPGTGGESTPSTAMQ